MARNATVIDQAEDCYGDLWDVREARRAVIGFEVLIGWPANMARGRGGSGGPKVILTTDLRDYLTANRHSPGALNLPIGRTAIKRLRRLLGHNWRLDRVEWWEDRADDLISMTLADFGLTHGVSAGAASQARNALYGPELRPAGWWREPDVAALIVSGLPHVLVADRLEISVGTARRLRWQLRNQISE